MIPTQRPVIRLVGLGNIGIRHLQGLSPLSGRVRLSGRDIDPDAVARAQKIWMSYEGAEGDFGPDDNNHGAPDLAVLATSANHREALVHHHLGLGARRLVLEKVVFTESGSFERIQHALDEVGAVAFVNTPRRLWPVYQALAEMVRGAGAAVEISVTGSRLGFACNGVHFIDLLQMLSGEQEVLVAEAEAFAPWASKRKGYFEAWGRARFETPGGSSLTLIVEADSPETPQMTILLAGRRLEVTEQTGKVMEGATLLRDEGPSPLQSELSHAYARPMLLAKAPKLPSLSESAFAHRALFQVLTPAFERAGLLDSDGRLPIT